MTPREARKYNDNFLSDIKKGMKKVPSFYNTLYYNHKDGSRCYLNNCIVDVVDEWIFIYSEHNGSVFFNKEDLLEVEHTLNIVEPKREAVNEEDYNEADFEDYVTSYEDVVKSGDEDRINFAEESIRDQMEH